MICTYLKGTSQTQLLLASLKSELEVIQKAKACCRPRQTHPYGLLATQLLLAQKRSDMWEKSQLMSRATHATY